MDRHTNQDSTIHRRMYWDRGGFGGWMELRKEKRLDSPLQCSMLMPAAALCVYRGIGEVSAAVSQYAVLSLPFQNRPKLSTDWVGC